LSVDGSISMLDHNRPQTLALLLTSDGLDSSNGLCKVAKDALDDSIYIALEELEEVVHAH